jgi:hypothetical protein
MADVEDLVTWLREQIAEDQRIAEATARMWAPEPPVYEWDTKVARLEDAGWEPQEVATLDRHVVRWDPARVLREVEAKRRILDDYERYAAERRRAMGGWDSREVSPILTALALPYSDRPGYREEWRP